MKKILTLEEYLNKNPIPVNYSGHVTEWELKITEQWIDYYKSVKPSTIMNKIPTAEEFLLNKINSQRLEPGESIWPTDAIEAMIEFAKLHCIEQARIISENVEADFEPMGWLAEQHLATPFIAGEDYEVAVSRHSILNAYDLNDIK